MTSEHSYHTMKSPQEKHLWGDIHVRPPESAAASQYLSMGLGLSPLAQVAETRQGNKLCLPTSLPSISPGKLPLSLLGTVGSMTPALRLRSANTYVCHMLRDNILVNK